MTRGISPLQMAAAYGVFPAQGRLEQPFTVIKVLDAQKKILYTDRSGSQRVISSSTAAAMDKILKAVVKQGTGSNARIAVSSGGKTGTTEGRSGNSTSQDLWYVGYTSDLSTAVWVGNADNSEIKGFSTYGGTVAGPVWRDYMNQVIRKTSIRESSPSTENDDQNDDSQNADNLPADQNNNDQKNDKDQNEGNEESAPLPGQPDTAAPPDSGKEIDGVIDRD